MLVIYGSRIMYWREKWENARANVRDEKNNWEIERVLYKGETNGDIFVVCPWIFSSKGWTLIFYELNNIFNEWLIYIIYAYIRDDKEDNN